ncbi:MAG: M28 family peptidase [Ignavibacterium sp.]|nr:M28 family peptidase [Ignavibacterium sp.]MCX7612202.1 M28 family peptidase [Ignavibacterium sp.]MDW8375058.1 M28 family peptidase [Ignavibacteriales bacterium]
MKKSYKTILKMKSYTLLFILFYLNLNYCQTVDSKEITSSEIYDHIKFLASDELEGRMTGSEQIRKAANYIKSEFEKAGLEPIFNGSYFQEFPFIAKLELGENEIQLSTTNQPLNLNTDFIPLSFTDNLSVEGELVFAGFGISAPDLNYDDYSDIDVKDKIVIVLRNHPEMNEQNSKFNRLSTFRLKTTIARDKGAKAIIFVNNSDKKDDDNLVNLRYDGAGKVKGIVAAQVKRKFIDEILNSFNKSLDQLEQQIVETKKPISFNLIGKKVKIKTEVKEVESKCYNVGGILKGNDPKLKNEYLVIGAHYDHLGWGDFGSLHQGEPQIHNGADDNASGTVGLLELSEKFASIKDEIKRSIIFFAFSGEEMGLLGSSYLVNNFPVPIENVVAMFNMDMIGRLKENNLIIYGTGTSSIWKDILNDKNNFNFKLSFNDEGFGPSDHSAFYGKKIPVLFFFTGTHSDYHRPSDDYEKINTEAQEKILKYIFEVAKNTINREDKPNYIAVERKDSGRMTATRVWIGTIPDFAGEANGYKISGVSEGSPAAIAGLKAGDIIIKFGDNKISNLYDFTYAMGNYKPGDKVKVVVKRGEEEKEFELELKAR